MISHQYRFIYIPIPKTGSTTFKNYVQNKAAGKDIIPPFLKLQAQANFKKGFVFHQLRMVFAVPQWVEKSGWLSLTALYPNYFVWTFIRNPFDRFLSFFFHGSKVMRVCKKGLPQKVRPFGHEELYADKENTRLFPPPYKSLEECLEQKQQGLWDLKEKQYIGQTKYTYPALEFERWHSRPQTHLLLELSAPGNGQGGYFDGNPCSFIGRLENFAKDFSSLRSILGLPHGSIDKYNVAEERGGGGGGKRRHYSAYYTKRARRLVEEIYARDLDLLGYEFEDETKTSAAVSLYDKDQLKRRREKTPLEFRGIGFKLYMLRLYFAHGKKTNPLWNRLMIGVVKKNPLLNYTYEKLYRPLKFRVLGKPVLHE